MWALVTCEFISYCAVRFFFLLSFLFLIFIVIIIYKYLHSMMNSSDHFFMFRLFRGFHFYHWHQWFHQWLLKSVFRSWCCKRHVVVYTFYTIFSIGKNMLCCKNFFMFNINNNDCYNWLELHHLNLNKSKTTQNKQKREKNVKLK